MTRSRVACFLLGFALVCTNVSACDDSASADADAIADANADAVSDAEAGADAQADMEADADTPLPTPPCERTRRPLVLAHGFLAAGDTWGPHFMRAAANGYCPEDLHAFDWNSLGGGDGAVARLDSLIDGILAESEATQVDLGGHSAGGGVGYSYLEDPVRAAKVAHYAHIASTPRDGPAGEDGAVPTLNLWSDGDAVVQGAGDIAGATNVKLVGQDHYEVATSQESFAALFAHFNDGEVPATLEVVGAEPVDIGGKALALGDNTPAAGATITVYETDPLSGARVGEAVAEATVGEDGAWGPVRVRAAVHHELVVARADPEALPIHYFREPFVRSNPAVYLRTLPAPGGLADIFLADLPLEDASQTVLIAFTASRATVAGRDTLTVAGLDLATPSLASAAQTTIAWFLYDADGDQASSGAPVETLAGFPFLNGVDAFLPAGGAPITLSANGRTLVVPALSVATEGPIVATFD